jgi:peptidoglycan/LPS O-acetylase OafA/YrhL
MQPLAVLLLLPVLVGLACGLAVRDTVRASSLAAIASPLAVLLCLQLLAPELGWNWLATLMVAPFATGFAVVAVLGYHGRPPARKSRSISPAEGSR